MTFNSPLISSRRQSLPFSSRWGMTSNSSAVIRRVVVLMAETSVGRILTHVADGYHRLVEHGDLGGAAHVAAGHRDGLGQVVGALPAHGGGDVRVLGAGGDDAADVG